MCGGGGELIQQILTNKISGGPNANAMAHSRPHQTHACVQLSDAYACSVSALMPVRSCKAVAKLPPTCHFLSHFTAI